MCVCKQLERELVFNWVILIHSWNFNFTYQLTSALLSRKLSCPEKIGWFFLDILMFKNYSFVKMPAKSLYRIQNSHQKKLENMDSIFSSCYQLFIMTTWIILVIIFISITIIYLNVAEKKKKLHLSETLSL